MQISLGKDLSFYGLLESQAVVGHKAAQEFLAMCRDMENMRTHIDRLHDIEHEGDELTHALQRRVVETFITPLDKEDLRELSQALDDVTDMIEAAAVRADLYRLSVARPDMEPLIEVLGKATELIVDAMAMLRKGIHKSEKLEEKLTAIHSTENESDRLFRQALRDLFETPDQDPLYVIKWKEMYDRIEVASDKCEDIAKIIGMILTKYA